MSQGDQLPTPTLKTGYTVHSATLHWGHRRVAGLADHPIQPRQQAWCSDRDPNSKIREAIKEHSHHQPVE